MVRRIGDEFVVNTSTDGPQRTSEVADLANGGFVVVWENAADAGGGDASKDAITARRFAEDGTANSTEFRLNTTVFDNQINPDVAGLPGGGFVATWGDLVNLGPSGSFGDIVGRVFPADGTLDSDEFLVNSTTDKRQADPSVTALSNGRIVAAWDGRNSGGPDMENFGIRARLFESGGNPVGKDVQVNDTTRDNQLDASVASLANGGFVVTWGDSSEKGADRSSVSVRAQIYNSDGSERGDQFVVNQSTEVFQNIAEVKGLPGGGFVVVWRHGPGIESSENREIRGRVFNADGTPRTGEFTISSENERSATNPDIAVLGDGDLAVVWQSVRESGSDSSSRGIRGRLLSSDGTPKGDIFVVNSTTQGIQDNPSAAALGGDRFAVTWDSENVTASGGPDKSAEAVRGQVFAADGRTSDGDGNGGGGSDGTGVNLVVANGTAQTLRVPFAAEVRGTAAAETVQVPAGASVDMGANTGDRVAFVADLAAYDPSASGNTLTLTNGDTRATIALNGEVELAFADGAATARIAAGSGGPSVTLGGQPVEGGIDPAAVSLDSAAASALAGNTDADIPPRSDATNLVVLDGSEQTLDIPFAADVRGTAAAETVAVARGVPVEFGGNAGDTVRFADDLAAYSFSQSGNVLTATGSNGGRVDIALNGDVDLAFADGTATATLKTDGSPVVEIGGEPVGPDFDPADVALESTAQGLIGTAPAADTAMGA